MGKILHVIERLSGGGPTRSLIALISSMSEIGCRHEHRIMSLTSAAYPYALILARKAGATVLRQPSDEQICSEIKAADIVQMHFWNTPAQVEFLIRDLPEMRLCLWFKILGNAPPQIITDALVDMADWVTLTSPASRHVPSIQRLEGTEKFERINVVPGIADFGRLRHFEKNNDAPFTIGYIGTVNFSKMHRDFIAISTAARIPQVRFIVCGGGCRDVLLDEARGLASAERFVFKGFVENIKPVLESMDIFGYPLCADTYATSEKSLQEAMYCGIPPVVFPHGGVAYLVEHERTGLVVHSTDAYRQALEFLYHHPAERTRIGKNAKAHIEEHFSPEKAAGQFQATYRNIMRYPKRRRRWSAPPIPGTNTTATVDDPGAERFITSLGHAGCHFATRVTAGDLDDAFGAERAISASTPLLSGGEGGIKQYRNHYPQSPHLRLWSGLVLLSEGKYRSAITEFNAATELGLSQSRLQGYVAEAARHIRGLEPAEAALDESDG